MALELVLAQANPFPQLLGNLQNLGLFQFMLPFLLALAIVYGVLRIGVPQIEKTASSLIAIIIAFFIMNYSGQAGIQIAQFFTQIFGGGLIVLTGLLIIIIFIGLAGFKMSDVFGGENKGARWALVLLLAFIGFAIFLGAGGATLLPLPVTIGGFGGGDITAIVFFLIIIALAVWFLSRKEEGASPGQKPQGG
ncbi:MAG: hypothetical protein HY367_03550 [Candidatus Aenigmarchaeota archaeon]|nr:hypothetical protein [Candidatus Aenigmarchaeota archaeon]